MTPFLPFTRPTIDEETIAGVADVLRSGWITSGPRVKEFEAALSEFVGGRPVRTFNSGTCTLEIGLRIAGIGAGHEVITTPLSWVATANVILEVGAKPVFVDVDPVTRNLDLEQVRAKVTRATRAIIPVDLSGLPVDRDQLYALAREFDLRVVEDAAQSLGSTWGGKRIGSIGDLVSFSFQANKNLTTSEGGCLVLNTEAEAKLAELYRLQGITRSGFDGMQCDLVGGKFNMTDIAARIGLGQLPHLDAITAKRHALARRYFEVLGPVASEFGLGLPLQDFDHTNWHLFAITLPEGRLRGARSDFMAALHKRGIGSGVHYPPIHLFNVYRALGWKEGDLPVAERIGRTIVTLPLFSAMTESDVDRVAAAVLDVCRELSTA
ncbi:MAG: DegT/DnrJ/EryC1/StrS aminotransferase family protein [Opitutaceae bacterium]|nr:DegT/DnrJ/EryC1/StrS aminotransferase family protein [Opitutaceae bacterium]